MEIEIRQARTEDIPVLEDILEDAVRWMDGAGLHQWRLEDVKWGRLSRFFLPSDFYIAYAGGDPAACMALIGHDPHFWPDIPKGQSLFLHKLAVRRRFSGTGVSKALIDRAKAEARRLGADALRLDCHQDRSKVRRLYEAQGFVCVGEKTLFGKYRTAFYQCDL